MRNVHRDTAPHPPGEAIVRWRIERLNGAGFGAPLAERLARDSRYDLHALLQLVDRGCRPDLAARILAPLDDADGRG